MVIEAKLRAEGVRFAPKRGVFAMKVALIVVGVISILVFSMADVFGYGDQLAFGRVQMTGTVVGIPLALAGIILMMLGKNEGGHPMVAESAPAR